MGHCMTYHPETAGTLSVTEYTLVAANIAPNTDVTWDQTTKRSTAATQLHDVTGDTITLRGAAAYWVFVSPDVTRAGEGVDVNFELRDGGGAVPQNKASFLRSNTSVTSNMTCFSAFNVPVGGLVTLTCRYTTAGNNIDLESSMSLHIWEIA